MIKNIFRRAKDFLDLDKKAHDQFMALLSIFDILPTAKAGGFCGQTAIAAEGSLTSPSARENALSL